MIYLFHGSDTDKVRTKAFEWVQKARSKEPNLVYTRIARHELSQAALDEAVLSGGLFVERMLVLLDDPFPKGKSDESEGEERDDSGLVEENIAALAKTNNAIVVLAPQLASSKVKKIAAKAAMTYVFDAKAARETARGFNSALVNALAARNRGALWLEVVRAQRAGDAPEMLHGLLHWKARDLMLKGSRAWTFKEARALSLDLILLLQDSRRGGLELASALERFALTI